MIKNSLLVLSMLVSVSGMFPAFAEVTEIQLDKEFYFKGDSINVKGSVDANSSGLVSIVLRDPFDKFMLLSQTTINSDNSFDQNIPINEKFQVSGIYNATAFILNMTAAKAQLFNFDTNSESGDLEIVSNIEKELPESKIINIIAEPAPKKIENQNVKQNLILETKEQVDQSPQVADFVDKTKNPEHYLNRYYNEPVYQSWFDRNYPNLAIEEAVGYTLPSKTFVEPPRPNVQPEIIPEVKAISTDSQFSDLTNNRDLAQMGLAVGGLVVLFGAVYGIKRKVDNNSKRITLNKDLIRRKIISPIVDSNPLAIIKTRLAKGEISIEEYESLKQRLEQNSI